MATKSKTRPKTAPAQAPPPPPAPEPKPIGGKLGAMAALLRRPDGATIAQLVEATAWKEASVRGAMAGALKARGLTVSSEKPDGGVRVYRLTQPVRAVLEVTDAELVA